MVIYEIWLGAVPPQLKNSFNSLLFYWLVALKNVRGKHPFVHFKWKHSDLLLRLLNRCSSEGFSCCIQENGTKCLNAKRLTFFTYCLHHWNGSVCWWILMCMFCVYVCACVHAWVCAYICGCMHVRPLKHFCLCAFEHSVCVHVCVWDVYVCRVKCSLLPEEAHREPCRGFLEQSWFKMSWQRYVKTALDRAAMCRSVLRGIWRGARQDTAGSLPRGDVTPLPKKSVRNGRCVPAAAFTTSTAKPGLVISHHRLKIDLHLR